MELVDRALAPSTRAAYGRVWEDIASICHLPPTDQMFPITVSQVADYLAVLYDAGRSASTICSHASAISYGHKRLGLPDPTTDFRVRQMLVGAKKTRPSVDSRRPVSLEELGSLCTALNLAGLDRVDRLAFRAIFLVVFFGLLRPGELVQGGTSAHTLRLPDVELSQGELVMTIQSSKTSSVPAVIRLEARPSMELCPVRAVSEFTRVRGQAPGLFFVDSRGAPITTSRLSSLMKRVSKLAGLGDRGISGHCLRIGGASHGALKGLSELQLSVAGRWRSSAVRRYVRRSVSVLSVS